ncbi:MAG TPA: exosortase E/protease, VPEID-CTERM system [Gemmataceae bacterium]|nr:exosortase E/protease, VPEID-CTERM system [Gemmataceae bacterium]
MSHSSAPSPPVSATVPQPLFRWLILIALLIVEVLLLTLRFDTESLDGQSGWWARLLGKSPLLIRFVIAVAAATLLLGGASLWEQLRRLPVLPISFRTTGLPFLGHLAALGAFVAVTTLLLEGDADASSKSVWTILWVVFGLATVGLWALIVLPARLWLQLIWRNRIVLLAGFGVGGLAWGAGLLLQRCWLPLAEATLWIVQALLSLAYNDVVCQPSELILGTSTFAVRIAPDCSGYEGIGLISVFITAYLWLFRRHLRFPQALLLWPAGVAIIWLSNSVRIAALIAIGTAGWREVALGGFHSQAGWLAFNAVALGLTVLAHRLHFFAAESVPATPNVEGVRSDAEHMNEGPYPVTAYLMPFLAILATTMVTAAFTSGFDLLYPLRVLAAAAVLWVCRRAYAELCWSWSWQPFALGTVVFLLWIELVPSGINEPSSLRDGLANLSPAWAAVWLIFRIAGATITVPLAEELAFRGYLMRRLQSADWRELPPGRFSWMSLLLSSIVFGMLHGHWLAGTLAGLAYAVAVYRRGRLLDAVLAHATTNALLAGYVLATGAWALWS